MIQPDDQLIDNIKNFELGQVVSTETAPAEMTSLDHKNRIYRQAIVEGYEDILGMGTESSPAAADTIIPVHRFKKEDISALLKKYADITVTT